MQKLTIKTLSLQNKRKLKYNIYYDTYYFTFNVVGRLWQP